jgi:uncharacterized protein
MYQPRTYRDWGSGRRLVSYDVTLAETDLRVSTRRNLAGKARQAVRRHRAVIEQHIARRPAFLTSLTPLPVPRDAPDLIRTMYRAGKACGVGPMAAVAGAIAEAVGRDLLISSPEVIVENGGDIFLASELARTVAIYAGDSPFSGKIGILLQPEETPLGVCTSSGTVGHSLSFGQADAVVVLAPDTALADAAATAIGNQVTDRARIEHGLTLAQSIKGLTGVVIVAGDGLGVWGRVELVELEGINAVL